MYVIDRKDRSLSPHTIAWGKELFPRVNEAYGARFREPISVLDGNGELLWNVKWESELIWLTPEREMSHIAAVCANFDGQPLLEQLGALDFSFVERYGGFWFEQISEYAWHIIRLLNGAFPEKRVCLTDPWARFFPEIRYEEADPRGEEGILSVEADRIPLWEPDRCTVYMLMVSLTWARVRHYNPEGDLDCTAVILDNGNHWAGLGDIFKVLAAQVRTVELQGWKWTIRLDHMNQYSDFDGDDCWGKFFAPAGTVRLEDLPRCRCVISMAENRPLVTHMDASDHYMQELGRIREIGFPFRLNERAMADVLPRLPEGLTDRPTLGMCFRSSDLLRDHHGSAGDRVRSVDRAVSIAAEAMEKGGYEQLFLATEDETALERFRERFGERLLYVRQKRLNSEEAGEGLICDHLRGKYASQYELGVDYLAVILGLSACARVLYNVLAGTVYLAGQIDSPLRPADWRCASLDAAELLSLRFPETLVLYGAGTNGRRLADALRGPARRMLFCDKRANEGLREADGLAVVPPEALPALCAEGAIVVLTPVAEAVREEIRRDLNAMGIPDGQIARPGQPSRAEGFNVTGFMLA